MCTEAWRKGHNDITKDKKMQIMPSYFYFIYLFIYELDRNMEGYLEFPATGSPLNA